MRTHSGTGRRDGGQCLLLHLVLGCQLPSTVWFPWSRCSEQEEGMMGPGQSTGPGGLTLKSYQTLQEEAILAVRKTAQ